MSYAESNGALPSEVVKRAGFEFAYSLKLITTTTPTYTLSWNDQRLVEFNSTGAVGTLKLPAQPDPWMQFEVAESAGVATALTVDANGSTINGSPTYLMNVANRVRIFRYVPATGAAGAEWKVVGGIG